MSRSTKKGPYVNNSLQKKVEKAMNSKSKHLEVGKAGEFLAMVFLKKKGLRLLNMNWRWHRLGPRPAERYPQGLS